MFNRKFYFVFVVILIMTGSVAAFADPIVELSAPRMVTPKIIGGDSSAAKPAIKAGIKKTKVRAKKRPHRAFKKHVYIAKPKSIVLNYDKISKMIEYGYYDDADKILQGAIARNSKDIKAQALWAVSLAKQSKLDPAQKNLSILLKKYPTNSNLHYAQGVVYYQRTASSNMYYRNNTPKFIADSLKEFKKAILLDKNNAAAYNAAGVISLNIGNQKDATDYFKKSLIADKKYSLAVDNLGTIDFINGKYPDAEKKFIQALSFNTQNTTAIYHMAQIGMQKKEYVTALHYLNNALSLNSNSPAIYNLMGKAYLAQGNDAAAINSFKKSLQVKPEFAPSYLDLANIYEKRGDSEFAVEKLKTALALDPNFNEAKLRVADISLSKGDYNQAIDVYSELVGVNGYNAPALKGLASAYYGQAQTSSNRAALGSNKELLSALNSINKAACVDNNDLEMHLAKLRLSEITNEPEQPNNVLEKITQSPANDLMSTVIKAEAYLALNDYANAQKTFDAAASLSKNTQDNLYLAEILIYHKQYDSAQKILSQILKSEPQNQEAFSNLDYIQKSRKFAISYYKTAQSFLKSNNQNAAIDYLSRSVAINPNNSQARLMLAELYEKQKNYQDAAANYRAYLGLEPNAYNSKSVSRKIKNMKNRL